MPKTKRKETKSKYVIFQLSADMVAELKLLALRLSTPERRIQYTDLIRQALAAKYGDQRTELAVRDLGETR